jgi:outer membrane protein OmpA-like peptidoglycan-associated protein
MVGGALATILAFSLSSIAKAGPAYTSKDLLEYFQSQKAVAAAKVKSGKTRAICFQGDDDPDCVQTKSKNLMLNFEFDSDHLTQSAKDNLAEFAKMLRDPTMKGTRFEIDGYTDATGDDHYNQSLSERRAKSALNFLLSNGAPRDSLVAKGFGKSNPVVTDPFNPENRRVEGRLAGE